jgi:hypothetical protein
MERFLRFGIFFVEQVGEGDVEIEQLVWCIPALAKEV